MQWLNRTSKDDYPFVTGWYRVMISGDSASIDGHEIYSYPDYETWAWFERAGLDELEDFIGGYKGTFTGTHDETDEMIFAYCGPFVIPEYERQ